eukprot:1147832-Pelagomonas_calceolata.AAC.3
MSEAMHAPLVHFPRADNRDAAVLADWTAHRVAGKAISRDTSTASLDQEDHVETAGNAAAGNTSTASLDQEDHKGIAGGLAAGWGVTLSQVGRPSAMKQAQPARDMRIEWGRARWSSGWGFKTS